MASTKLKIPDWGDLDTTVVNEYNVNSRDPKTGDVYEREITVSIEDTVTNKYTIVGTYIARTKGIDTGVSVAGIVTTTEIKTAQGSATEYAQVVTWLEDTVVD